MKLSLNWVKEYLDFELPALDILVEKIGAQLGAVEEVADLGAKYKGIVIVKVVKCEKLEGSDHLSVCLIDDGGITPGVNRGENGYVQVVCGAPNVQEGVTVAWLPPGATVPSSVGKEPFVLEARELRGVISNGMLASPAELAISDNHDGLLLLDDTQKPGADFAKAYGLDDTVIDIENKMFTHRPDCFGQLGLAREVAGILGHDFKSPEWYAADAALPTGQSSLPLEVKNEIPSLVPRFVAVAIAGVSVGPSPMWLQSALTRAGLRPINNIVDITNYYMMLTGQPLHAYDYDKLKALDGTDKATITVRNPRDSERLTLLNGKTINPRQEAILIASATKPIGLGGVMGGAETEVDDSTKNIVLECASFDMYSIRRTSMAHGIFSDAVSRFNKGQSPLQNSAVAAAATQKILEVCGGQVASDPVDDNHLPLEVMERGSLRPPVTVAVTFVNARLGLKLSAEEMARLLTSVEFICEVKPDQLTVSAPFWRADIELREDVVEEVGRLYGFDKLPLELPTRPIASASRNELLELKDKVRDSLAKAGANELLTYSFVHGKLLEQAGQDPKLAFKLTNALSPDLQYYRLSLTPSLLDKVHPNIKAGYDQFALFEIGKGHNLLHKDDDDGLPAEFEMLDVVVASRRKQAGAAYYQARAYAENLAASFGLELEFVPFDSELDYPVLKPYDLARSAQIKVRGSDDFLGAVGEYKPSVRRFFKLPDYCAGLGIGLKELLAAAQKVGASYTPLPRFPKIEQDICFKVAALASHAELQAFVTSQLEISKPANSLLSVSTLDIYQREDDTAHKQTTFRIGIASYDRTLTDKEVNGLLDDLTEAAKQKFNAERI